MSFKNPIFTFTIIVLFACFFIFAPVIINSMQLKINMQEFYFMFLMGSIILFAFVFWPIRKVVLLKEY